MPACKAVAERESITGSISERELLESGEDACEQQRLFKTLAAMAELIVALTTRASQFRFTEHDLRSASSLEETGR